MQQQHSRSVKQLPYNWKRQPIMQAWQQQLIISSHGEMKMQELRLMHKMAVLVPAGFSMVTLITLSLTIFSQTSPLPHQHPSTRAMTGIMEMKTTMAHLSAPSVYVILRRGMRSEGCLACTASTRRV